MRTTYFVVQSFQSGKRGALIADAPYQAQNKDHAIRTAQRFATSKAGVIAFFREGDPTTGEWDDAIVLFSQGQLPHEAEERAA